MKLVRGVLTVASLSFSVVTYSAISVTETKVVELSAYSNSGKVLIRTEPRPNISELNCTNNYWLVLDNSKLGYQTVLSFLLSAQATGNLVYVTAEDGSGDFCSLNRINIAE